MNLETLQATCSKLTLEQVLKAREDRARRQQGWLTRYKNPLISTTLVWPGEVKDTPLSRRVMDQASDALVELASIVCAICPRGRKRFGPSPLRRG